MEVTALQLLITLQRWGDCLGSKQPFSSESFGVLKPFEKRKQAKRPESVWRKIELENFRLSNVWFFLNILSCNIV